MKKIFKFIIIILMILIIIVGLYLLYPKNNKSNKTNEDTTSTTTSKVDIPDVHEAKVNISFVGDLLYEKRYMNALNKGEDVTLLLSKVKKYFLNDDITIGNMETLISDGKVPLGDGDYTFCVPEYIGDEIVASGFDVLGTANNHSNDRGYDGIASTINYYKKTNVLTVGTYLKDEYTVENQIIEKNGIKFGFIGYTNTLNKLNLSGYQNSLNYYLDLNKIKVGLESEVNALRDKVDCLIVVMHWGKEFNFEPYINEVKISEMLNEMGVDIIMGSHSHSIKPIKWIKGNNHDTLVFYGMGNFISADPTLPRTTKTYEKAYQFGLLANLNVIKDNNGIRIEDIKATPVISYYDNSFRNFTIVPYDEYDENYETTHYMYKRNDFTKNFVKEIFEQVIDEEFR